MAVPDSETTEAARRQTPPDAIFWAGAVIALAHLAVVLVRPSPTTAELAGFELVVFAGLAAIALFDGRDDVYRRLAVVAGLFATFVGGTWLLLDQVAVRWAAVVVAVVGSLCAYGLHRYQLVALGLVEENDEQ